jgi:hypothetical protein
MLFLYLQSNDTYGLNRYYERGNEIEWDRCREIQRRYN